MKKTLSRKGFTLVELLTVIAIIGILASVLIPTIGSVLEKAKKQASSANAASIAKTYFGYSTASTPRNVRKGKSYSASNSTYATSVTEFAAVMANKGQLNDAPLWFIAADDLLAGLELPKTIIDNKKNITKEFRGIKPKSWAVVASLSTNAPVSSTPLLWTRGLGTDGTWAPNSPWKGTGGHIAFLDGHVEYFEETTNVFVDYKDGKGKDGESISNYKNAINATAVVLEDKVEGADGGEKSNGGKGGLDGGNFTEKEEGSGDAGDTGDAGGEPNAQDGGKDVL
jgi:prepilin-type N-terminal cleavage/methylation domain-containing protein/prepilin-type processing-associated H-X9-DG protein